MDKETIGIGMIGYAFMGRAHSHAWRTVDAVFDAALRPELVAVCGRDQEKVRAMARRYGWGTSETEWERVIERDDVQLIDICTPSAHHAVIATAALEAGKHVLCEKPLAGSLSDAEAMTEAAENAGRNGARAMVAFNYRRLPAIALARELASTRLGEIRHIRATYLQEWPLDPDFPLLWRFVAEEAGAGALGDMASHIVDLAHHLTGQRITAVSALTKTFIDERPLLEDPSRRAPVSVDDAAAFLAQFTGGATGTFEVSRLAPGQKNSLRLEINGSLGSLRFDLERLNELEVSEVGDPRGEHAFRRILVTEPEHPYIGSWWPPGHILGWEHTFVHQAGDLLRAIAEREQPRPSFHDGLEVQAVLAAVLRSASGGQWADVSETEKEAA